MKLTRYIKRLPFCLALSILLSFCQETTLLQAANTSSRQADLIPVVQNPDGKNHLYAMGSIPTDNDPNGTKNPLYAKKWPFPDPSPDIQRPMVSEKPSSTGEPDSSEPPIIQETPAAIETPAPDSTIPSSYDLRNDAIITGVKDQGSSGACWAFSALKSAESNAIHNGILPIDRADFSENHLVWFSFHASKSSSDLLHLDGYYPISNEEEAAYYMGGSALLASFTMARWSGIVLEQKAPFEAATRRQTISMAATMKKAEKKLRYQSRYHMQNATCYDKAGRKVIQNALLTKGALSVGLYYAKNYMQTNSFGVTTYYQNTYQASAAIRSANHCVTIIGWDDHFSRNQFPAECRPPKDGAWLIANSYGTSVGDQGYFWLSYYEPSICEIYSFEVEPSNNYDTNYQYDGCGWGSAIVGDRNGVKAANIYTAAQNYHQSLQAVGLYTIGDNQPYKIEIYTNVKKNKPCSGTLVSASTTSGSIKYNGFHTIPLKQPVSLKAGSRFSVVITYTGISTGKNYMPIEGSGQISSSNKIQTIYGSQNGQSFYYSTNANKWLDIAKNGYNNLCVKAFAKNTRKAPFIQPAEKKIQLGKGETCRPKIKVKNLKKSKLKYKSSKPSVAKVGKNGKITAKRTGNTTITISAGAIHANFKVKVKKAPANIKLKQTVKTLKKKQRYQICPHISAGSGCYKFQYRSNAPRIASVDSKGKVTARKKGNAVIRIRTYNHKTVKLTIRVK